VGEPMRRDLEYALENDGCTCLDGHPCGCLSPSLCICDDPDPQIQGFLARIKALEGWGTPTPSR